MKTRMSNTSLEAYKTADILTGKQKVMQVFEFAHQRFTAKQVSKLTGLALGTTTARINQLRYDDGKLTTAGEKDNESLYCLNKSGITDSRPLSLAEQILEELQMLPNFCNYPELQNFINNWNKKIKA